MHFPFRLLLCFRAFHGVSFFKSGARAIFMRLSRLFQIRKEWLQILKKDDCLLFNRR